MKILPGVNQIVINNEALYTMLAFYMNEEMFSQQVANVVVTRVTQDTLKCETIITFQSADDDV